jgi:hypothetical protein
MGPFMVSRALAASMRKREDPEQADGSMNVPGQLEEDEGSG